MNKRYTADDIVDIIRQVTGDAIKDYEGLKKAMERVLRNQRELEVRIARLEESNVYDVGETDE